MRGLQIEGSVLVAVADFPLDHLLDVDVEVIPVAADELEVHVPVEVLELLLELVDGLVLLLDAFLTRLEWLEV